METPKEEKSPGVGGWVEWEVGWEVACSNPAIVLYHC